MAETRTDGGPAFPQLDYFTKPDGTGGVPVSHGGMPLRDYFAAAALTGAFRGGDTDIEDDIFARRCYAMADAMLKAREAK